MCSGESFAAVMRMDGVRGQAVQWNGELEFVASR